MLMLVVTLIIASVVSAFAGGLWGNTEKAPGVTIQAELFSMNRIILKIIISHYAYGWGPFQIKDVKLVVSNDTWNMVFTNNTSSNANLMKFNYEGDTAPNLIRAGDKFFGKLHSHRLFCTGSGIQMVVDPYPKPEDYRDRESLHILDLLTFME